MEATTQRADVRQPVARTAFYCCVIRADDAQRPNPVCGDTLAARFVDDEVKRNLAPLTRLRYPAASNVARHRLIDDIIRTQLGTDPSRRIILLGAGLDTRAYRMQGGRWFELDDRQLLAFKEARLPAADAPNPLTRLPVWFESETPEQYLGSLAGDDEALVVLEGVSMYLSDASLRALGRSLVRFLPRAPLVCDLMSQAFEPRARAGGTPRSRAHLDRRAGAAGPDGRLSSVAPRHVPSGTEGRIRSVGIHVAECRPWARRTRPSDLTTARSSSSSRFSSSRPLRCLLLDTSTSRPRASTAFGWSIRTR
jgi:methyltransferase (TIGR00027 family)